MARTFTHTDSGVTVNGFFISWEDFDKLEPSYHYDEKYPQRIYRIDRVFFKDGTTDEIQVQGAHVLIDETGVRHTQILPWPEGDSYCNKRKEYESTLIEWAKEKSQVKFRAQVDSYKKTIREMCKKAETESQKSELENILQEIDNAWNDPLKRALITTKLGKFFA